MPGLFDIIKSHIPKNLGGRKPELVVGPTPELQALHKIAQESFKRRDQGLTNRVQTQSAAPAASTQAMQTVAQSQPFNIQTFQPLLDLQKQLLSQAGVPALQESAQTLREQIAKTESALSNLEPNIRSRTKDFLVTEPQVQRRLAVERDPLTRQLGELSRSLGVEEAAISSRLGQVNPVLTMAENIMASNLTGQSSLERQKELARFKKQIASPTQSSIKEANALSALKSDIEGGDSYEDIVRRYANLLPTYKIRDVYEAVTGKRPNVSAAQEGEYTINPEVLFKTKQRGKFSTQQKFDLLKTMILSGS